MKVGDWEIEDAVSFSYFILYAICTVINACVAIWITTRIIRDLKKPFIDLLKMTQHTFIIICFCDWIFNNLCLFWYKHTDIFAIKIIFFLLASSLFIYYALNLLTCFLLIFHIKNLEKLKNGISYQYLKDNSRNTEILIIFFLVSFILLYIVANTILLVYSNSNTSLKEKMSMIESLEFCLFFAVLFVFQFILYKKFLISIKNHLNFYFRNKWKSLSFIMFINALYFLMCVIWNLSLIILNYDENKLIGISESDYSSITRIIFLLLKFFIQLELYIYVFLNSKDINFKCRIFDIFLGHKILHHYPKSSVFIIPNNLCSSPLKDDSIVSSRSLPNSFSSSTEDKAIDYEVNDDYMKNYKRQLIMIQNSSQISHQAQ